MKDITDERRQEIHDAAVVHFAHGALFYRAWGIDMAEVFRRALKIEEFINA